MKLKERKTKVKSWKEIGRNERQRITEVKKKKGRRANLEKKKRRQKEESFL
jgi:hypothetical protein